MVEQNGRQTISHDGWVVLGARDGRKCRRLGCPNPAVAALQRRHKLARSGFAWWAYCGEHLYGRRIRNGIVEYQETP